MKITVTSLKSMPGSKIQTTDVSVIIDHNKAEKVSGAQAIKLLSEAITMITEEMIKK